MSRPVMTRRLPRLTLLACAVVCGQFKVFLLLVALGVEIL